MARQPRHAAAQKILNKFVAARDAFASAQNTGNLATIMIAKLRHNEAAAVLRKTLIKHGADADATAQAFPDMP